MRLGGRLQAAIEILETIEKQYRPITSVLKDWGNAHRFAGSGDRTAIGNIVYDALRMKSSHIYVMDDNSPAAIAHAVIFRQWGISPDELKKTLDGDKFAPEPLPESTIEAYKLREIDNADAHIQADIPEWILDAFKTAFGDDWLAEAQSFTGKPPLDLRVNTLKSTREKVLSALSKNKPATSELSPQGIRITAPDETSRLPNVTNEISFAKGWYEVQDEGSQLAAALVGAQKGDQVLDYCAGGGGKALALSAAMENGGQIHAFDSDKRRMAPMIERLRRAGTRNVQLCENDDMLLPLVGNCDHVLVDAPCTGTGTWRRRPDIKWRLSEKNLADRTKQQSEVVRSAAQYVKPGGHLTYVTCSILPEENDDIVQSFLTENSEFSSVDPSKGWQAVTGNEMPPRSHDNLGLLCSPHRTGTDGFYIAKLERKA